MSDQSTSPEVFELEDFASPERHAAGIFFEDFCVALSVWRAMQPRSVTVADAAAAFNASHAVIERAVSNAAWMYLDGEGPEATIESEGL